MKKTFALLSLFTAGLLTTNAYAEDLGVVIIQSPSDTQYSDEGLDDMQLGQTYSIGNWGKVKVASFGVYDSFAQYLPGQAGNNELKKLSDSDVSGKVFKYSQDSRKEEVVVTGEKLYIPGIYSATGTVTLGDKDEFVSITMLFEEDSFTEINIDEVSENLYAEEFKPNYGVWSDANYKRLFAEEIGPDILEAQSSNFIGVSDMPMASKATRLAVEDCIKQAKGEKSENGSEEEEQEDIDLYYSQMEWKESGEKADFIILNMNITNTQKNMYSFLSNCSVTVEYEGEEDVYQLGGWAYPIDTAYNDSVYKAGDTAIFPSAALALEDEEAVDVLYEGQYLFGSTLPNNIIADENSSLKMIVTIDGNEMVYVIR